MSPLAFSQAAENNKRPILNVLEVAFKSIGDVLEIGSGTGQHAVFFGQHLPHLSWQPSERIEHLPDLEQRLLAEAPANVKPAIALNVADDPWPVSAIDAIFSANCVHIMSWGHVEIMFQRLEHVLRPGGALVLYGPYKYGGGFTTQSNADFDQWLKSRDPVSGIRDFEKVNGLAKAIGLELAADHAMPANNQCLVWQRP